MTLDKEWVMDVESGSGYTRTYTYLHTAEIKFRIRFEGLFIIISRDPVFVSFTPPL